MKLSRLAAWLVGVMAIAAVLWLIWTWGGPAIAWFHDRAALQAWLASFGAWAPLVGIALNTAQVIADGMQILFEREPLLSPHQPGQAG